MKILRMMRTMIRRIPCTREMIDSAYNSQKILGTRYPNSELSRSILKIANGLMRVENELKLKNKSSGLKRFARILGLTKQEEEFN